MRIKPVVDNQVERSRLSYYAFLSSPLLDFTPWVHSLSMLQNGYDHFKQLSYVRSFFIRLLTNTLPLLSRQHQHQPNLFPTDLCPFCQTSPETREHLFLCSSKLSSRQQLQKHLDNFLLPYLPLSSRPQSSSLLAPCFDFLHLERCMHGPPPPRASPIQRLLFINPLDLLYGGTPKDFSVNLQHWHGPSHKIRHIVSTFWPTLAAGIFRYFWKPRGKKLHAPQIHTSLSLSSPTISVSLGSSPQVVYPHASPTSRLSQAHLIQLRLHNDPSLCANCNTPLNRHLTSHCPSAALALQQTNSWYPLFLKTGVHPPLPATSLASVGKGGGGRGGNLYE